MDQWLDANSPPQWGLRLITHDSRYVSDAGHSPGCPDWANGSQQENWQAKGLIVWNNSTHRLVPLEPWEALALLERLRATQTWKTTGGRITKRVTVLTIKEPRTRPKVRKSKQAIAPQADVQPDETKAEEIDEEIVALDPEACQAVLAFLERNEKELRGLAQAAEAERRRVLVRAYDTIFRGYRSHEFENARLNERSLPWAREMGQHRLTCEAGPKRATVSTDSSLLFFWYVDIECHQKFSHRSPDFDAVIGALDWAEKELTTAPDSPEPAVEEETYPPSTVDLRPYEIAPAALEPSRVTFRAFIELEHTPLRHKTFKLSSGESLDYDEEYPTGIQLAHELKLDAEKIDVEQVVQDAGWYRIRALITLFQESLAISQTQALWERSAIAQQYRAKQVTWAYFGYQEAETGFTVFLGGCESTTHAPPTPESRAEYLAEKARRLTFIHALDVVGYRAHLQISRKWLSDADLLRSMHRQRAESQHIPAAAREESRRWLEAHVSGAA